MFRTLIAALILSSAAFASTTTLFFTALPSVYENGTYNGFVNTTVNGIPNQLLICDDYFDVTHVPSKTNQIYDFSTLTGSNPLQYAMFDTSHPASAADIKKYEEAAVLVYNLFEAGPHASADFVTDTQYALWHLMNANAPFDSQRVNQEKALLTSALSEINDPSKQLLLVSDVYKNFKVYTPTAQSSPNQEFLQYSPAAAPEPSTVLLSGLTLLGIGGSKFWRRLAARRTANASL